MMNSSLPLILIAFFMAVSVAAIAGILVVDRNRRLEARLKGLSQVHQPATVTETDGAVARAVRKALPKMAQPLIPDEGEERTKLQQRLILGGLYSQQAMAVFLGAKMFLMVAPTIIGFALGSLGLLPLYYATLGGIIASICGMIAPSFWLDRRKKKRQLNLRRSLPDACDLLVICMEGGLSLGGSLKRVVSELRVAHPLLAAELNIVQRKVQLGQPLAEAISGFASRTEMQEIKSLSSTVKSAEKFGSSMVGALQNYASTLRIQRQQKAEEMAQKASTKVLFPTLLFIFPSILIIILGPAAVQMMEVMSNMNR